MAISNARATDEEFDPTLVNYSFDTVPLLLTADSPNFDIVIAIILQIFYFLIQFVEVYVKSICGNVRLPKH